MRPRIAELGFPGTGILSHTGVVLQWLAGGKKQKEKKRSEKRVGMRRKSKRGLA